MKKQIRILAALMFVTFSVFFTSCEKEGLQIDTDKVEVLAPDGTELISDTDGLLIYGGGEPMNTGGLKSTGEIALDSEIDFPFAGGVPSFFTTDHSDYWLASNAPGSPGMSSGCVVVYNTHYEVDFGMDIETPETASTMTLWYYNTEGIGNYVYAYVHNATEGEYAVIGYTLLGGVGWISHDLDVGETWQDAVDAKSNWGTNDEYKLHFETSVLSIYVDWIVYDEGVEVSPSSTISGVSFLTVPPASLPSYTATFTAGTSNCYAYQWSVVGEGVIVGSSTGNSVTIDFDTYGGKQIYLKVKEESGQEWSSLTYKSHTVYPQYY